MLVNIGNTYFSGSLCVIKPSSQTVLQARNSIKTTRTFPEEICKTTSFHLHGKLLFNNIILTAKHSRSREGGRSAIDSLRATAGLPTVLLAPVKFQTQNLFNRSLCHRKCGLDSFPCLNSADDSHRKIWSATKLTNSKER